MRMTKVKYDNDVPAMNRLAVDTEKLCELLSCGRPTAVKIGDLAKARIEVGVNETSKRPRLLWNVQKIQEYLNEISK